MPFVVEISGSDIVQISISGTFTDEALHSARLVFIIAVNLDAQITLWTHYFDKEEVRPLLPFG